MTVGSARTLVFAGVLAAACGEAQDLTFEDEVATVDAVQDLTIRSSESHPFTRPLGMTVDGSGKLWVLEPVEAAVFVFDSAGRFVARHGRRGQGPGEFDNPVRIGMLDDSVWISDGRLRRVVWFDLEGRHLGTRTWGSPPLPPAFTPAEVAAVFADGTAAARAGIAASVLGGGSVARVPLLRLSAESVVMDTLHMLDFGNTVLMLEFDGMNSYTSQPFGARDLWASFPDGSGVVLVHGTGSGDGRTALVEVERLSYDGSSVWSRTLELSTNPVTTSEVDSAVAAIAERRRGRVADFRALENQVRSKIHVPEQHPPVDRVLAAADGRVWIRQSLDGAGENRWLVLDPSGEDAMSVTVDPGVSLQWADANHMWGVERDSLGVPTLIRYRLAEALPPANSPVN